MSMFTYTNANVTEIPEGYFWIKVDYLEKQGWMVCQASRLMDDCISIEIDDVNQIFIYFDERQENESKFELRGPIPDPGVEVTPDRYQELLEKRVETLEAMLTAMTNQAYLGDINPELLAKARSYLGGHGPL